MSEEKISLEFLTAKLSRLAFGSSAALDVVEAIIDNHGLAAADVAINRLWLGEYLSVDIPTDSWVSTGREPAWDFSKPNHGGRPPKEYTEGWREWGGARRHSDAPTNFEEVA